MTGYVLGSIPFGYLIVWVKEHADVRQTGSGGTGATNVTRRAGKWAGVATLALDAAKGALAVLIALWMAGGETNPKTIAAAAAVAAVTGHVFPVWLKFRGGKGVATGLGAFLCLAPMAVAAAAMVFLICVVGTRYVSLGSICAAATLPLWIWLFEKNTAPHEQSTTLIVAAVIGGALIIFAHRANIRRLVGGTENKFR